MTQQLNQFTGSQYIQIEESVIEDAQLAETDYVATDYASYFYEEEETDSAKVFFGDDSSEEELDFSPTTKETEFIEKKQAISALLDQCMKPLINRIEQQSEMLLEKELEIEQISMQLKLLPDLQSQIKESDEELKLKHFENQALKKQFNLSNQDKKTADDVTKLSNQLIKKVEQKAIQFKEELDEVKQENSKLKKDNSRLAHMKRPWWQKVFSCLVTYS